MKSFKLLFITLLATVVLAMSRRSKHTRSRWGANGNFSKSCTGTSIAGTYLLSNCKNTSGNAQQTFINLESCISNNKIDFSTYLSDSQYVLIPHVVVDSTLIIIIDKNLLIQLGIAISIIDTVRNPYYVLGN